VLDYSCFKSAIRPHAQHSKIEIRPRTGSPKLFSKAKDFAFFDATGTLSHRRLPRGPRGYTVVAVDTTGHQSSFIEEERTVLTIPHRGQSKVSVSGREYLLRPGDMFAISPAELHSQLRPLEPGGKYSSYTVISPPNRFGGRPDESPARQVPNYHKCLQLRQLLELSFEIYDVADFIFDTKTALVEALIEEMFMEALALPGAALDPGCETGSGQRIVDLATQYMVEFLADPMTAHHIATQIGVDVRTLQRSFAQCRGVSPRQFLSEMRLQAMRSRLVDPEPGTTVTSAALDSGLCHLGRCSPAYKERFGELPSETLFKARPGPARLN